MAEAKSLIQTAVDGLTDESSTTQSPRTLVAMTNLACVHFISEQFEAAAKAYQSSAEGLSATFGPGHPLSVQAFEGVLQSQIRSSKFAEVSEADLAAQSSYMELLVGEATLELEKSKEAAEQLQVIDASKLPLHRQLYLDHLKAVAAEVSDDSPDAINQFVGSTEKLIADVAEVPILDRWMAQRACERMVSFFEGQEETEKAKEWKTRLKAVEKQILELRSL